MASAARGLGLEKIGIIIKLVSLKQTKLTKQAEARGRPLLNLAEDGREAAVQTADDASDVTFVLLDDLHFGEGVRDKAVEEEQLLRLMELGGRWVPILVWRDHNTVLDGVHRVEAARRLGLDSIAVTWFCGSPEEAFIEAVVRNVRHGLPLTMAERLRASGRILRDHSEWSDRRIAAICAVSDKTVARLRGDIPRGAFVPPQPVAERVGRDGKRRPTQSMQKRAQVAEVLRQNPGAPLRAIAAATGVSPETVRGVRLRLETEEHVTCRDSVSPGIRPTARITKVRFDRSRGGQHTLRDPAFLSESSSRSFAAWFDSFAIDEEWRDHIREVPLSRVYEVADEARRRAKQWSQMARALEERAGRRD